MLNERWCRPELCGECSAPCLLQDSDATSYKYERNSTWWWGRLRSSPCPCDRLYSRRWALSLDYKTTKGTNPESLSLLEPLVSRSRLRLEISKNTEKPRAFSPFRTIALNSAIYRKTNKRTRYRGQKHPSCTSFLLLPICESTFKSIPFGNQTKQIRQIFGKSMRMAKSIRLLEFAHPRFFAAFSFSF